MSGRPTADADEFLALLSGGDAAPGLGGFFREGPSVVVARAPGRLDVMGGFADYSGSLTLEMPIAEAAFAAVQEADDGRVRVSSLPLSGDRGPRRAAEFPVDELRRAAAGWDTARAYFERCARTRWAAYLLGGLVPLLASRPDALSGGFRLALASRVPEGKGVSSSAAIEVAALKALSDAGGVSTSSERLALDCQRVENLVVGAPCGVMDQMTSSCGEAGRLLPLLCQPARREPCLALPKDVALWGVDSGIRHEVSGADYGQVRVAAFMGYRIIADALGLNARPAGPGRVVVEDSQLRGYLANVTVERFEKELAAALPRSLSGAEFLSRYGGITDPVTAVDPRVSYRVFAATAHPIREHERALELRRLLSTAGDSISDAVFGRLGELMAQTHESYSECGLGSSGTDLLVELVRSEGASSGLFGAKVTGGGSGGTVAVLGRRGADASIDRVARRYRERTGKVAQIFSGSSPGAFEFGSLRASFRGGRFQWDGHEVRET